MNDRRWWMINAMDSYSKRPMIVPIKSASTGSVINSLYQIFINQGVSKLLDDASYWYPNVGALLQISLFSVCNHIFRNENGSNVNLPERMFSPMRNPETPETQSNHRPESYSERFRRSRKRLKVDLTLERMDTNE
ncbi:hypothetical protein ACTXT7_010945 [Hymenolepis weldensis]